MGQGPAKLPPFTHNAITTSPIDGKIYINLGQHYKPAEVHTTFETQPTRLVVTTQKMTESPLGLIGTEPEKKITVHIAIDRDIRQARFQLRNDGILIVEIPRIPNHLELSQHRWYARTKSNIQNTLFQSLAIDSIEVTPTQYVVHATRTNATYIDPSNKRVT